MPAVFRLDCDLSPPPGHYGNPAKGVAMISEALAYISPDCDRLQWVKILMAIKSELGEAGLEIAEQWSQESDKFELSAFHSTWRSICADGGITAGTLFAEAKRNGWSGKVEPAPRPIHKSVKAVPPKTLGYALDTWARVKPGDFESLDKLVSSHPYATKKSITWAAGATRGAVSGRLIGQDADCIIIPQRTYPEAKLCGIECINPEGRKQTFGKKGVLILGNDLDPGLPQLLVEGWATGAHFQNLRNCAVYVCGGKGQLPKIAAAIGKRHPNRKIILMGERDD